jgi:serine protease Do
MITPPAPQRETPLRRSKFTRNLVAGVSALALIAGLGLAEFGAALPSASPVRAEQVQAQIQGLPSFTTLVEQVKPAVFSVQVDIDPAARLAQNDEDDGDGPGQQSPFQNGENPFKGTPFEHFFDQFGKGQPGQPGHGAPDNPHGQLVKALGSGFFITADGYAVTNNHVVDGAAKVEVVTDDGKTHGAKVVGTDPKTDLALLKVEGRSDFAFVKMAPSMPKIGDWVLAVGNPYGLGGTVTAGIVSAENRDIGSGPYDDFIQIDAAVNRGNSGGPTFNLNGEVIGVNTAIYSPSGGSVGIAFAIPTTTVQAVIPVLRDKGHLDRAWLGVQIQPVTEDIAQSLGLDEAKGALIDEPQAGGPGAKAGLKAGDVITRVDGKTVADARDLARIIGAMAPDSKAELTVIRGGKESTMRVALGALPDDTKQPQLARATPEKGEAMGAKLGLSVAPAASVAGHGRAGLLVMEVDPSGPAADLGIRPGDIILKIGERDVHTVQDLRQALTDAKAHGRSKALALVKSGNSEHYVALPAAA